MQTVLLSQRGGKMDEVIQNDSKKNWREHNTTAKALKAGFLNSSYTFTFINPLVFLGVKGPFTEGGV